MSFTLDLALVLNGCGNGIFNLVDSIEGNDKDRDKGQSEGLVAALKQRFSLRYGRCKNRLRNS